ncbi:MAG: TonB-dependent receptor [Woeseia sp.]|nr:TonB-dependent receptor [Woeseia sp.]
MKIQRILAALLLSASTLVFSPQIVAQEEVIEEVTVTGIRASLRNAVDQKRNSDNLVEVIIAEDIGKLPDQNLAEVLENVTGIQITRTAGVGTGVQIRGTNANRTEINGVSTVGSGSGRSGISFDDVSAGIIAAVEVTKAPEAKTIEGSVGGTINLKTIRPLSLTERLATVRLQGEDSSLSTDSVTPRLSGTYGDNWTTDSGDFGVVLSASYAEQDVTAFRPRADRDNDSVADAGTTPLYLPIQFFIQDYDNFEYETTNFAGTLEFEPSGLEDVKFYLDVVLNDQDRRQKSSRIQASGISAGEIGLNAANISEFETVNFGSLNGQNLGSIDAAVRGIIPTETNGTDGNLRFSGDTNSRITDSKIFSLGGDWLINDRFSARAEVSTSSSDSSTPSFNTTLNFINPNSPLNAAQLLANHQTNEANGDDALYDSNENGTPFEYDLRGGSLTFGILQDAAFDGPTTAQLLDPANIVLRDVQQSRSRAENEETAFRADFSYDVDESFSFDFGYRFSKTTALRDSITSSVGLREFADSPTGNLFSTLLVPGPNNFNAADGRALYVPDFLVIDPERVASDPDGVLGILNDAIVANNAITGSTRGPISAPTSSQNAFFDIEEKTNAFYGQMNFEAGIFRGNAGLRYLKTEVASTGNTILNGVATPTTRKGNYDFVLPRLNIVANLRDDLLLRAGWGSDIRRPDFDDLSTSFTFSTSPNPAVNVGNPGLVPQEVESFDISLEYYFAPAAVVSLGFFHKTRTGLFVPQTEEPETTAFTDANGNPVDVRDVTDPCEGGGIFNPIADQNVFAPLDASGNQTTGVGVCVPLSQQVNGAGENTQKGFELAFQYDLVEFEDTLGWASGFGFLLNYTNQKFSGGEEFWGATTRARDIFAASGGASDVKLQVTEIDLSDNAYNITLYYEKYGLSARTRYTWREAYRSTDFGSTSSFPWGFPVVQDDRGQLNASVQYAVTDNLSLGLEAVNITEEDVTQYCVNENALLCYQGLTDRRLTFGASYRF